MHQPISVSTYNTKEEQIFQSALYAVFLTPAQTSFAIDGVQYYADKQGILFLTPFQKLVFAPDESNLPLLSFHGDFYCIEYHKKEVACNGLLFNDIYANPAFSLPAETMTEIEIIFQKIEEQLQHAAAFTDAVVKSYLQLLLALCSKEKSALLNFSQELNPPDPLLVKFKQLLESSFLTERAVAFYADALHISPAALSRKIKAVTLKTPSQLIRERVILESKKQLHLTYKSVKEIASDLNFQDEFYFSRYFKNEVGLSPAHFREKVGISIVAG